MATTVDIQEVETHFSRLLQRVLEGEEMIIAKAGQSVAILPSAIAAKKPSASTDAEGFSIAITR